MEREASELSNFISSYWNYYLELEEAFKQTQKYVAFDKHNDKTYSVEYLKLIQAVCSEIDVVAKEIARHFDQSFDEIKKPTIIHWGYFIANNIPQITEVQVYLDRNYVVRPWEKFGYKQYSDKNGNIRYRLRSDCKSPSWWSDYNKLKHERTSRNSDGQINFEKANLKNMVLSLAALFSLESIYIGMIHTDFGPRIEESSVFDMQYDDSSEPVGDR